MITVNNAGLTELEAATVTILTLETYTFGLSRSTGKMRFRREGEPDILVDRLVGQWWVQSCDRDGNIHAECAIDVRQSPQFGTVAYLYHPDIEQIEVPESEEMCALPEDGDNHDSCHIASTSPYPNGRSSHWRCCYAREIATTSKDQPCWRFRDERTGELWFIQGYEGPMNVNWFDHGTHVFFDGVAHVDEDMICHFSEG